MTTNQEAVTQIAEESPEAAGLVYALISASMDANNRTIDNLLEMTENRVDYLARALVKIAEILDEATVIDRRTEARLMAFDGIFATAQHILDTKESRS